jgi:hypothetical protein
MSFDVERRLKSGNLKSIPLRLRDPDRVARQRARKRGIGASKIVVKPEERKRSGIFAAIAAAAAFLGRRR